MKKNGKNEELQSRREFFKRAAKGALPILAGAALLSSPILSETANAMSCAGCNNRCMNSCFNTLKSYIYNSVAELRNNRKYVPMNRKIVLFFYSDTRIHRYNRLLSGQERVYVHFFDFCCKPEQGRQTNDNFSKFILVYSLLSTGSLDNFIGA